MASLFHVEHANLLSRKVVSRETPLDASGTVIVMHADPLEPPPVEKPLKNPKPKSFRFHRSGPKELGLAVAGRDYWWRLGRKIALVSAHTTALVSLIFLPVSLWFMGSIGPLTGWFLGAMLAMLLISLPMGWVVTFLWNALLGLVLLPGLYLGQRLIGEPIRRDTTGWIAGSAVAIVGSAGGLFHVGSMGTSAAALSLGMVGIIVIQIGSGLLSIAAAQAGGYLGSLGALRRRRRRRSNGSDGQRVRFTVWRLMAVTAILSVLLSLFRLAGEFAVPLIISVVVSSILAWAIHRPVAWATNRWLDWRLKKRRAKRLRARVVA